MKITFAGKEDLAEARIQSLVGKAVYRPTPDKISRLLEEMKSGSARVVLAFEDTSPVGILLLVERAVNDFEIRSIYVEQEKRMSGVGRGLICEFVSACVNPRIEAETDDDAVNFYRALGFRIQSLGEKYPGIIRYRCTYDHTDWSPIDHADVSSRFKQHGVPCWI